MKPYYEHRGITIYHGDCREIMPLLPKADLVIADPPYGMNFQSGYRIIKHEKITGDRDLPVETIKDAIAHAKRAAYIFCRWDNLNALPPPTSVLAWVKNNWSMGDLKHEHGRQWEAICFYPQAGHEFVTRIPDVVYADRTGNNLHPTEKPVELIGKLMQCNVCETVLDPYMGSGTALLAAKERKLIAIGIDIEEKHCETAAQRLSQEVLL